MTQSKNGKTCYCTIEAALDVIGGKWKPLILWHLGDKVLRFGALQKGLPGVNTKMITKQLRQLKEDRVIKKTVYPEVPPRGRICDNEGWQDTDSHFSGALQLGEHITSE